MFSTRKTKPKTEEGLGDIIFMLFEPLLTLGLPDFLAYGTITLGFGLVYTCNKDKQKLKEENKELSAEINNLKKPGTMIRRLSRHSDKPDEE